MTEAKLIAKTTADGKRYAVEFRGLSGRTYQTLFTSFREEACAWGRIIRETGWCVSGRPMPVA